MGGVVAGVVVVVMVGVVVVGVVVVVVHKIPTVGVIPKVGRSLAASARPPEGEAKRKSEVHNPIR